jgi:SAM-dependent methyltransferase
VGLDLALASVGAFRRWSGVAVTASAEALPFHDNRFDVVWSFGLLHHLDDEAARRAVLEMVRVTRLGGATVVVDSVWPDPVWRRPVAWALRRLDRGGWVRSQAGVEALLPGRPEWSCERFDYEWTGLEGIWCAHAKRKPRAGAV